MREILPVCINTLMCDIYVKRLNISLVEYSSSLHHLLLGYICLGRLVNHIRHNSPTAINLFQTFYWQMCYQWANVPLVDKCAPVGKTLHTKWKHTHIKQWRYDYVGNWFWRVQMVEIHIETQHRTSVNQNNVSLYVYGPTALSGLHVSGWNCACALAGPIGWFVDED